MCILIHVYTQGPENESRIWTNKGYNALIVSEALSTRGCTLHRICNMLHQH